MSDRVVTASELARNTAAVLDAVERGEQVVIERRGRVVARLEPTAVGGRAALGALAGTTRQLVDDAVLLEPVPDWST
jgi:prevent-host-death family protein